MSLELAHLFKNKQIPLSLTAIMKGLGVSRLLKRRFCSPVALGALALAGCLIAIAPFSKTRAQTVNGSSAAQVQDLVNRLDRVQRDILTLQQFVYQGKEPPAALASPAEQEAKVAARARLNQIGEDTRRLTGQLEQLGHNLRQLVEKVDRLAADTDLRLQRLELAAPGATTTSVGQQPPLFAKPDAGSVGPEGSVQTLGSIPQPALNQNRQQSAASDQTAFNSPAKSAAVTLPDANPAQQYHFAFDLLKAGDYVRAESAFRQFLEANPTDSFAGNAQYWLGETYYVRSEYRQAAIAFADGYQKYPDSRKAPDNLLKLGMSLSSLEQTADACGTFKALLLEYPGANPILLQRATKQKEALSCP